jgi:hypothetical protein
VRDDEDDASEQAEKRRGQRRQRLRVAREHVGVGLQH